MIPSLVAKAVEDLTRHKHDLDLRFGVSTNRVGHDGDKCRLRTHEESHFTAMLAHYIACYSGITDHPSRYGQFFYTPSRRTEEQLGCDLSVGHFDGLFRARIMHKIQSDQWCDTKWDMTFGIKGKGATTDCKNLRTLIIASAEHPNIHPYLVVTTAWCVHDARRMGYGDPELAFSLPPFNSLMRNVVIDLSLVTKIDGWKGIVSKRFGIRVVKQVTEFNEADWKKKEPFAAQMTPASIGAFLVQGATQLPVQKSVLTLDGLCDRVVRVFHDNEKLRALRQIAGKSFEDFCIREQAAVENARWPLISEKIGKDITTVVWGQDHG